MCAGPHTHTHARRFPWRTAPPRHGPVRRCRLSAEGASLEALLGTNQDHPNVVKTLKWVVRRRLVGWLVGRAVGRSRLMWVEGRRGRASQQDGHRHCVVAECGRGGDGAGRWRVGPAPVGMLQSRVSRVGGGKRP